jgi:hypothetical protein
MQAWNLPPLPNASPQPANVTVTGVTSDTEPAWHLGPDETGG